MSTAATLTDWKAGVEDVVATRSAICTVDGANGRLYYRGYEIADLAGRASFEEITHLLWFGELPGARAAPPAPGRVPSARRPAHRGVARRHPGSRRAGGRPRGEPRQVGAAA